MSNQLKNSALTDSTTPAAAKPGKPEKFKPKPDGPKPKPKPDAKSRQLLPLQAYSGTVGQFDANPDGVLDRFQLATADKTHTVKFPPHFGQALLALAQPGQAVTVLGFLTTTPKGDEHLHLARLDAAGATAHPAPPTAEVVTLSGPVAELKLDPKGHLRALLLADEATELRLPPHLAEQLAPRLAVGTLLTASGPRRALRPGEVLARPEVPAPLQVELLTVGEESFMLR